MNYSFITKHIYRVLIFIAFLNAITVKAQTPEEKATQDSILIKEVESQMQESNQPAATQRSSLSFNPDIGVIGDFRGAYVSRGEKNIDAYLNETEISLQSVVDPYVRADFFISLSRNPETHEYGVEVEEGYLTTLTLPGKLQLRAGKFKSAVGRINPVHAHALPFIEMPNAYVNYFGDEGLNDEGASLSWLVPNKKFYQELVFQATSGFTEAPVFSRSEGNRLIYLGHLKNFFTLNENATLEVGLTGITGPNEFQSYSNMASADLTYKWKPVKYNTYRSITWQSEVYFNNQKIVEDSVAKSFGLYSFVQYQLSKRWFLTGMYDYAQSPSDKSISVNAYSITVGWLATEFQKIEVEGKITDDNFKSKLYQVWLRWIFVIGAHGAHQY